MSKKRAPDTRQDFHRVAPLSNDQREKIAQGRELAAVEEESLFWLPAEDLDIEGNPINHALTSPEIPLPAELPPEFPPAPQEQPTEKAQVQTSNASIESPEAALQNIKADEKAQENKPFNPPSAPPTLTMPRPSALQSTQDTPNPTDFDDESLTEISVPRKTSPHTPPSTGGLKGTAIAAIAALAGFFGVKIAFEETRTAATEAAEDAVHAFNSSVGKKMAAFPPARFEQQPSEPPETIHKQEARPLTRTYTIVPSDTLWGLASNIVEEIGVEDTDGTLTLQTVKKLREANDIQGDPARSQKMWVGKTLDLTSAYDFVVSQKTPEAPQFSKQDASQDTPPPPPDSQHFSAEMLSPTLNYPGETVWSRTHDMLESLGMKPNMAKRGVLGAIVLADSHKTEAQAARIKYAGHKKFDPARDTLNFTRAAEAALDLQNGMSPGDVAKKYGVKNQYERFRDR